MEGEMKEVEKAGGNRQEMTQYRNKQNGSSSINFYRVIRDCRVCTVRGFTFNVIQNFEGKWSGDMHLMKPPQNDLSISEKYVIFTKVAYDANEGIWTCKETIAAADGLSSVLNFRFTPVANGMFSVDFVPEEEKKKMSVLHHDISMCSLTLQEMTYGFHFVGYNRSNGNLVFFQILTFTQNGNLEASATYYQDGELQQTVLVKEKRIV